MGQKEDNSKRSMLMNTMNIVGRSQLIAKAGASSKLFDSLSAMQRLNENLAKVLLPLVR